MKQVARYRDFSGRHNPNDPGMGPLQIAHRIVFQAQKVMEKSRGLSSYSKYAMGVRYLFYYPQFIEIHIHAYMLKRRRVI